MSPLGIRLKHWRERRDLTQAQLSELARVRQPTISDLEKGKAKSIRFDTLERLCKALDVSPGQLLKRES